MTLNSEISEAAFVSNDDTYQVSISGYQLAEVPHGKRFYVYTIDVKDTKSYTKYSINRRYSEFNALHRALKKQEGATAPFPPKRVRNSQPKVLEQRRVALEHYIKKMLKLEATKRQVLEFLGIEGNQQSNLTRKRISRDADTTGKSAIYNCQTIGHHPVISFKCDPYLQPKSNAQSLPDIVTQGVLLGIYKPATF